ncbi:sodium-dependent phosphate transport protein 1 [Myotis lucifugus]|uniref:sodium-dependent phosphate transport protein 1 n=1 Tax=Myotis lucifugus TaxID=59463 RepID=UPI000CCC0ADB|nr:sodium-dependent phosphate transport protein 1 [Myotis lucifugus]
MDEKPSARRGPDFCSLRYGLAVVMHLSNLSMITQRVSLSIAIIAMVNSTQQPAPANASADGPLQDPSGPSGEFHAGTSVYAWSPETQGLLFSSISYGILLTLIPSGYLAGIFGAKHMLGAGLLASSLLSLCTPLAADLGVSLVMVIRVAQGMAQSGVLSSLPFLAASTCTVLGGQLADFLLSRDLLGLLTVRKLFSALGLLLPSLCAVALPFVASSYVTTVVLLILIPGTSNLCDSGFIINTLDIAPRISLGTECLPLAQQFGSPPHDVYLPRLSSHLSLRSPTRDSRQLTRTESRPFGERSRSWTAVKQMDDGSRSRRVSGFCSLRCGLALLLHFCNVSMMSQRACLSLTMVAMVNGTGPQGSPNTSAPEPLDDVKNPVYNWSPQTQGIILSSVTYGMLITQVPVGYLSGIYPVKNMVGSALLLSSLLSLLTPLAAGVGESAVIACRVAQGLSQGTVLVAQHTVWTKWAPPQERGRLTSLSLSGLMLGPSVALCVTGLICQALGWPMVFYIFGESPVSPCPCSAFKTKLRRRTGEDLVLGGDLLKLHVNVRENGLLSALPHLCCWLLGILAGHVSDGFLSRKMLSLLAVRKLFTALGLLLPAVFVVGLLYLGPGFHGTVACLTLASATLGFCVAGMVINPLDIAPRYYGFLKGVTVLIGMTGGLISSTLAGIILNQDPEAAWSAIFFLVAAVNVSSLLFYLVFAAADVQAWAQEKQLTRL